MAFARHLKLFAAMPAAVSFTDPERRGTVPRGATDVVRGLSGVVCRLRTLVEGCLMVTGEPLFDFLPHICNQHNTVKSCVPLSWRNNLKLRGDIPPELFMRNAVDIYDPRELRYLHLAGRRVDRIGGRITVPTPRSTTPLTVSRRRYRSG